ncbi:hypothetical protein L1887_07638 [Cichorium endivia]|nr:hypothetical protein L1887_07638 [Cichorium endivia]
MAACGSLQHIFDKPSPLETPKAPFESSWKHINPIKAIDDMFSELHFMEKNDSLPSTKHYQCNNIGMNAESLSMCTEGLGFESFDDVEDLKDEQDVNIDHESKQQQQERTTKHAVSEMLPCEPKRSRFKGMEFPPPISSIGMGGKPWVYLESYRSNGRFILKEVKIPTQELLHACREDGRLKLQFIQSDGEALDEEDDEERKNGGDVSNKDGDGAGSNEIRGESS